MHEKMNVGYLLERLASRSSAGFAIGLHVRFSTPRYFFQKYGRDWIDLYTSRGFLLQDPIVRWGMTHTGITTWTDLRADDPAGVLTEAARFGMAYGICLSIVEQGSRSLAGFARSDREFTEAEIAAMRPIFSDLHAVTLGVETLSPEDHAELQKMSIFLSQG
jgi:LuxR family transcriptional regulator